MRRDRLPLFVCAGLVMLTVLTYGQLWGNDFVNIDDTEGIAQNPQVWCGLSESGIRWAWSTFQLGNWIPLTWLSLQLDATLFRVLKSSLGRPQSLATAVHAQNLLWHTATVVLLFLTFRRLTGSLSRSALVAALFAVHPLHVESVAWATERKDVLSTFFGVLTLLAYAHYSERPRWGRYLLMASVFALGLLAKPMLVTWPFVLLLLDWWPLQRGRAVGWARLLGEKVPVLVLAAAASVVAVLAQEHTGAVVSANYLSFSARLANAIVSYGWYLTKTFWPTGLAVYYCHPLDDWGWESVLASSLVFLCVTGLAVYKARTWPWLLFGWLWFLGTLVPVIGLVQVGEQAHADRYSYVPHIGLFVALVWSAAALADRLRVSAWLRASVAMGCLLLLAVATSIQVGYWRESVTLWTHALAVTTGNHWAHNGLGQTLFHEAMAEGSVRTWEEAHDHFEQAVALQQDRAKYRFNLGVTLLYLGHLEQAEEHLAVAVRLDPQYVNAWHNLGIIQRLQGHLQNALESLQHALELNPRASETRAEAGQVLWRMGRWDEAAREWQAALQLNPREAEARNGMGLVLLRQGLFQSALEQFTEAVGINPDLIRAWGNRGIVLGRMERWNQAALCQEMAVQKEQARRKLLPNAPTKDEARYRCQLGFALHAQGKTEAAASEYARARELNPQWPRTNLEQAWQLATDANQSRRDAAAAWEMASQVCQASNDPSAEALDVLAAALASQGRFPEAVKTAQQALVRADADRARTIEARIRRYEDRLPPE